MKSLDCIIDDAQGEKKRHCLALPIGAPSAKLRQFDDYDWMSYAGCESKNPEIAEDEDWGVIVLDDASLCITLCMPSQQVVNDRDPDHPWNLIFTRDFASVGDARYFAECLLRNPDLEFRNAAVREFCDEVGMC